MAGSDGVHHVLEGFENVLVGKVAEHTQLHFGSFLAESLCGVVVAVGSGEYRNVNLRVLNFPALVLEVGLLRLEGFDAFHALGKYPLHVRSADIRINAGPSCPIGVHKAEDIDLLTVDMDVTVLSACHLSEINGSGIIQIVLAFDHD